MHFQYPVEGVVKGNHLFIVSGSTVYMWELTGGHSFLQRDRQWDWSSNVLTKNIFSVRFVECKFLWCKLPTASWKQITHLFILNCNKLACSSRPWTRRGARDEEKRKWIMFWDKYFRTAFKYMMWYGDLWTNIACGITAGKPVAGISRLLNGTRISDVSWKLCGVLFSNTFLSVIRM